MTFDPHYAIVTASDSGIGKATAVALAEAGMDIGVTWHSDSQGAEETAEEVRSKGRKAVVKQLDYTDLPSCAVTIDMLIDDLGGLDVFVNNAGAGDSTLLVDTSYDDWRKIIATNLDGTFVCMRQAARHMVEAGNGGRLIAVTSVHEHQPRVGSGPYDAAKHGIVGLTKTVALELARSKITCNCISPGYVWTPLVEKQIPNTMKARNMDRDQVINDVLLAAQPTKEFVTVEQVASLALFLCGEGAAQITGANLSIDGGWTAA